MAKTPQTRIGISGWTYIPWRGVFYPQDVTQKRELQYAAGMLNSIEINGSFYSLQRPGSYQTWYEQTPPGFLFSVKGGRYITHMRKLRDIESPLANFFASGVLGLKEKLGPILWQFPPVMRFDLGRFEHFFQMLPKDTQAAADLAKGHDAWMKDRALTETDANRPLRHAVEIRNSSFETPEFVDLLRRYNVAVVFADTAGHWPYTEDLTADFVYLRLHGDEELYASGYTPEALDGWAAKIRTWSAGKEPPQPRHWSSQKPPKAKQRDVYVYFDNDVKVKAPFDAMSLADRLGPAALGTARNGSVEAPAEIANRLNERVRSHWPIAPRPAAAPKKKPRRSAKAKAKVLRP